LTEPTDLNKFKKRRNKTRAKGKTMCKSGFHQWEFDGKKQFDVKQGKLISRQTCRRCGLTRNHVS
jgi:hypothetical protein